MLSAKVLGMLIKSAHKNWKKAKEDKFFAEKFDPSLKICKNEGNVDVRNIIIIIYLFVSRHEVHSMNTHTLQNAG